MAETCVLTMRMERIDDQRRADRAVLKRATKDGGDRENSARIGGDTGRRAAIERMRTDLAVFAGVVDSCVDAVDVVRGVMLLLPDRNVNQIIQL